MKTFADKINGVKNANVDNDEKMKMLLTLGLVKSDCYALFNVWRKEGVTSSGLFSYKFKYTFGVEMETYNCRDIDFKAKAQAHGIKAHGSQLRSFYNHEDSKDSYKCVYDSSIDGVYALECVSPILNEDGFESLEKACQALRESGAKVNKSCGLHVHIGAAHLTGEQYVNVFNNYKMLENVIDSFMAESRRGNNSRWCRSIKTFDFNNCNSVRDVLNKMDGRYYKVNPQSFSRHSTIEFRQHQGSINFEKIQHRVRFCANLVEWSRTNKLEYQVDTIDEIKFITDEEKAWFKNRIQELR